MVKKDITSREDIKLLVNTFYGKVRHSEIAFLFEDVAKVNWEVHLPRIYDFWVSLLLGEGSFQGNVMEMHFDLHSKSPLTDRHFQIWIDLFSETVKELFFGEKANETINRATAIKDMMAFKILKSKDINQV